MSYLSNMKRSDRKPAKSINVRNPYMHHCNDYGYVLFGTSCKKDSHLCISMAYNLKNIRID